MDLSLVLIAVGLFTFIRAVLNSSSLMEGPKGKFWTKLLKKKGARVFYLLLGSGLIAYGVLNYGNIIFP